MSVEKGEQCPVCGGNMEAGETTFAVDLKFGVVVVRHVPATVCAMCGEEWFEDHVTVVLEKIVETAKAKHCTIEVADWPYEKDHYQLAS